MGLKIVSLVSKLSFVALGAVALSACVTIGGGTTTSSTASAPNASAQIADARPVNQPQRRAGMLSVEPANFDANDTPAVCVNDLRLYASYLQMPGESGVNLNKPINDYIREAGGAVAAINVANAQVIELRQQLDSAMANRDPFDQDSRKDTDDVIATLEDGILLNQALAEAIACRGNI